MGKKYTTQTLKKEFSFIIDFTPQWNRVIAFRDNFYIIFERMKQADFECQHAE